MKHHGDFIGIITKSLNPGEDIGYCGNVIGTENIGPAAPQAPRPMLHMAQSSLHKVNRCS